MVRVIEAQYRWTEHKGFVLDRKQEIPHYIIAQYFSRIALRIGGRTQFTPSGSIAIVAPGVAHGYRCSEALVHHWVHADGNIDELLAKYGIEPNRLYAMENSEDLSNIFRQIALTYHDMGQFRDEYMALKIEELLITMGMHLKLQTTASDLDYNAIVRLKELRFRMIEHPEYGWSISEMARQVCISESYFFTLYRKYFGVTPNRDLIGIRIDHARINLRSGYSVTETAEKVGYSNVYHFIRQFKKQTGMTPNQCKKKLVSQKLEKQLEEK